MTKTKTAPLLLFITLRCCSSSFLHWRTGMGPIKYQNACMDVHSDFCNWRKVRISLEKLEIAKHRNSSLHSCTVFFFFSFCLVFLFLSIFGRNATGGSILSSFFFGYLYFFFFSAEAFILLQTYKFLSPFLNLQTSLTYSLYLLSLLFQLPNQLRCLKKGSKTNGKLNLN